MTNLNWYKAPKDGSIIGVQFRSDGASREARWNESAGRWDVRAKSSEWTSMALTEPDRKSLLFGGSCDAAFAQRHAADSG
jgi:hypothetical protein